MENIVERYGVHWGPGKIAFLHQARGATNAIGLHSPSPFTFKSRRQWVCNHMIGLANMNPAAIHFSAFQTLLEKDSLARFMLPIPKDASSEVLSGVARINAGDLDSDLMDLILLLKMSSPVRVPIFRMALTNERIIMHELSMTNVQPMVLAGVETKHTGIIGEITKAAAVAPRKLLLVADERVPLPGVRSVTMGHQLALDQADLMGLPWESFGACVLRAYMRQEWGGAWFERDPVPGNVSKPKRDMNHAAGSESARLSNS